jgi:hypothetical protein
MRSPPPPPLPSLFASHSARTSTGFQLRKAWPRKHPRRPSRLSTRFLVRLHLFVLRAASADAVADMSCRPEGRSNQGAGPCRWPRKGEILQWSSRRSTRRQDVGLVTNIDSSNPSRSPPQQCRRSGEVGRSDAWLESHHQTDWRRWPHMQRGKGMTLYYEQRRNTEQSGWLWARSC